MSLQSAYRYLRLPSGLQSHQPIAQLVQQATSRVRAEFDDLDAVWTNDSLQAAFLKLPLPALLVQTTCVSICVTARRCCPGFACLSRAIAHSSAAFQSLGTACTASIQIDLTWVSDQHHIATMCCWQVAMAICNVDMSARRVPESVWTQHISCLYFLGHMAVCALLHVISLGDWPKNMHSSSCG